MRIGFVFEESSFFDSMQAGSEMQFHKSITLLWADVQMYAVIPLVLKVATPSAVISVSCQDLGVLIFTGYNLTSRLAFVDFTWYRHHVPASGENTHFSLISVGTILNSCSILVLTSCGSSLH